MPPFYRIARVVVNAVARVVLGFTVYGEERVPAEGPLVIAANHRRFVDPIIVSMAVPRWVKWMAKKELFSFGPFARVLYFVGAFPVDRQKGGRAALRRSMELLREGEALGIFPEGTRQRESLPRAQAKSGVAMLAVRTGAPVVPVYVGSIPGPLARLRGERLEIYIGDPIRIEEGVRGGEAYRKIAAGVLQRIYDLRPEKEGGV
ncbi:1-acyl-sn-glycerol-3-phosphate acyltransferase [Rubrobacter taiwanensis]|uniref:1-acyl-sn-glycerol-3-phosphate acyltransferase n=1 Tax=Rubrobacter taiwanensis TaxID=185139 RepID=A0A4R1BHL6_9ACTN|nr:lysophospholipid acyltransferase family protein [Rubrobacter taiwanensis]TCJ16608.1 1-acyl-sn-glycerol-3-phosphate acyltransferase [Rubrobacter taiwanensis]